MALGSYNIRLNETTQRTVVITDQGVFRVEHPLNWVFGKDPMHLISGVLAWPTHQPWGVLFTYPDKSKRFLSLDWFPENIEEKFEIDGI